MSKKIKTEDLVESINLEVTNIVDYVLGTFTTDFNSYNKGAFNEAFNNLKNKERTFLVGQAMALRSIVRGHGLSIDQKAWYLLRALEDRNTLEG